jgi:MinD superfamily P-loop ATPase
MRIAVLSGKGGTGKTLVSVNLACAADKAVYADCDVEEPNGHLFLKPEITEKQSVTVAVPEADMSKCNGCRKCVDFCKYNALALLKDKLMIFYEVCHSCGGCILFCPQKALGKKQREIGTIETGVSENVTVLTGCLNTGEVSGVPIIKRLMEKLPEKDTVVIDCPPVVLNKCLPGENPSELFCRENKIGILAEIPFDEHLGRLNSEGLVAARESEAYRELFQKLLGKISKGAAV